MSATVYGGRCGRPQLVFDAGPHDVGLAQVVKVLAQTDVAVVHAQHAVTGIHQCLHQLRRPGNELHAQAHDQQHHRALGGTVCR
jgi:hypothetical protein